MIHLLEYDVEVITRAAVKIVMVSATISTRMSLKRRGV